MNGYCIDRQAFPDWGLAFVGSCPVRFALWLSFMLGLDGFYYEWKSTIRVGYLGPAPGVCVHLHTDSCNIH